MVSGTGRRDSTANKCLWRRRPTVGTPFYLYSQAALERNFQVFDSSFREIPHLTCYAIKANSNIAILRVFRSLGAGFDIVSGGELFRALKAGADPQKIV